MATAWPALRRIIAMRMGLWGGKVDGSSPAQATFTSTDAGGSLYVVYDVNRPEPDDDWNGAYICINPGGTGNPALPTIWRRLADLAGYVNFSGAMTLTSPLPSSLYASTTMTYELFKSFKPEDWMNAVNNAMVDSYPSRHRLVAFEVPEDPTTTFYDYAHLASELSLTDPSVAPTVTVVADPGGRTNTWSVGTYKVAYNIFNSAGETVVSPTVSVTLAANQVIQIGSISVPEGALGVNYFATPDPGGSALAQLSVGAGVILDTNSDNIKQMPGIADPTTFVVPQITFWGPPWPGARTNPGFNTSVLDHSNLQCRTVKLRTNPGQFPEQYVDLNTNYWREVGGSTIKLSYRPLGGRYLRFECTAPCREIASELDTTDEPQQLLVSGAMKYLFNQQMMAGSAVQNVDVWKIQVKMASDDFREALGDYKEKGPRRTTRSPKIRVSTWGGA